MTNFLHTNSWLNWVDEDDWRGWGWFWKARRRTVRYIQMRPEAPAMWENDFILNWSGTADSGMGRVVTPWRAIRGGEIHTQGCHSLESHRRGWNPYPGAPPTTGLLVVSSLQSKIYLSPFMYGRQRIIYNAPPSRPHQVAFYDIQSEGHLLLPRSSMGTILLDLRPKAEHTFVPFGV